MKLKSFLLGVASLSVVSASGVAAQDRMYYEIVQDGAGIAPTADKGFGSSAAANGTPLGTALIQKYSRRLGEAGTSIAGRWISAGDDVAPLLRQFFKTDSVLVEFSPAGSYVVVDYQDNGANTISYLGTYTSTPTDETSDDAVINNIVINQTLPSTATARGIYAVWADTPALPDSMLYEIVQDGAGTAPTPTTGFGSTLATSGQALGTLNIQRYKRVTGEPGRTLTGRWLSAGSDVAQLLRQFFSTDSVVAQFNADLTYLVQDYQANGARTVTFSGSYQVTASDKFERNAPINVISVNQVEPATATARGIFAINPETSTSVDEDNANFQPNGRLSMAFPNPVQGQHCTIRYTLQRPQQVTLQFFNAEGKLLRTLLDKNMPAGEHTLFVETTAFPSGTYYYRLQAEGQNETGVVTIVR